MAQIFWWALGLAGIRRGPRTLAELVTQAASELAVSGRSAWWFSSVEIAEEVLALLKEHCPEYSVDQMTVTEKRVEIVFGWPEYWRAIAKIAM